MIFCVSPEPYHEVYGNSSEQVRQLFQELRDIGIGGVNVSYKDPDEHPEWRDYIKNVAKWIEEFDFRISMHAPGGDISSTDESTRKLAVAKQEKAIHDIGQHIRGVIFINHPENALPNRSPGDDDVRRSNCRKR